MGALLRTGGLPFFSFSQSENRTKEESQIRYNILRLCTIHCLSNSRAWLPWALVETDSGQCNIVPAGITDGPEMLQEGRHSLTPVRQRCCSAPAPTFSPVLSTYGRSLLHLPHIPRRLTVSCDVPYSENQACRSRLLGRFVLGGIPGPASTTHILPSYLT